MISGVFHAGSGLGNQLARYVMTRVVAYDNDVDFGMLYPENFKGYSFLQIDMGRPVHGMLYEYNEKRVNNAQGVDIRGYDWEGINSIKDGTIIDGEFQGEEYFKHARQRIEQWLKTEELRIPENVCVISFRGGEYVHFPDLFLRQQYWQMAMAHMRKRRSRIQFHVVTDDIETARAFFPHLPITHDMADDWKMIRYARNLILSNSSFAILPAWLNKEAYIIAPRWWARHNVSNGYWAMEQNKYKGWNYLDREGNLELCT